MPEKFYGGGNIRIKGVKQVQVTNDYLRLDMKTRGCQNDNTYEVCVTDLYLDSLREKCNCLPFNLKHFGKQDDSNTVFRSIKWVKHPIRMNILDKNMQHNGGEEMC